jgi:hypothetical protein
VSFLKKTFGCCEDGNCLRMGKRPFQKLPTLKKRSLLEQLDAEDKIRAIQVAMSFVYVDCVDNLNIEFVKAVMPHCTNDQWDRIKTSNPELDFSQIQVPPHIDRKPNYNKKNKDKQKMKKHRRSPSPGEASGSKPKKRKHRGHSPE